MNRILKSQHEGQTQIDTYERLVAAEKAVDRDQRDTDYIMQLERQIAVMRSSQETLSKDYKDLQTRITASLKDLKGTREQRIKQIEDSKQTFASIVKLIATDEKYRTKLGIEMEKMRLATEKEKERLSEYHTYEDGVVDQPFLTPETLINLEKNRNEE